jgi:hypothetical protein
MNNVMYDDMPKAGQAAGTKACAQCRRGLHNKCNGRRHSRLERRFLPCECKECDRRHTAVMAQTAGYINVVEDSL